MTNNPIPARIVALRQLLVDLEAIDENMQEEPSFYGDDIVDCHQRLDAAIGALAPFIHNRLGFYESVEEMVDAMLAGESEGP